MANRSSSRFALLLAMCMACTVACRKAEPTQPARLGALEDAGTCSPPAIDRTARYIAAAHDPYHGAYDDITCTEMDTYLSTPNAGDFVAWRRDQGRNSPAAAKRYTATLLIVRKINGAPCMCGPSSPASLAAEDALGRFTGFPDPPCTGECGLPDPTPLSLTLYDSRMPEQRAIVTPDAEFVRRGQHGLLHVSFVLGAWTQLQCEGKPGPCVVDGARVFVK